MRLVRFEDLLNNTNTAENPDFQELRKGTLRQVKLDRMARLSDKIVMKHGVFRGLGEAS